MGQIDVGTAGFAIDITAAERNKLDQLVVSERLADVVVRPQLQSLELLAQLESHREHGDGELARRIVDRGIAARDGVPVRVDDVATAAASIAAGRG